MSAIRTIAMNWWNSLTSAEQSLLCNKHNMPIETVITGLRMEMLYNREHQKSQPIETVKNDGILDFLKFLDNKSVGTKIELIQKTTPESSKTREGSYFSVKSGLAVWCYFVGKDLTNNKMIVERVG